MSILFTLVTFLLFVTISYLRQQQKREAATGQAQLVAEVIPRAPQVVFDSGFQIPKGYSFQPGHTWLRDEGSKNARIGMDNFAATLLGKVDRIEVGGLHRWVRQGQKIWTVRRDGLKVDMLSPVEGLIVAANPKVLQDPSLVMKDPYGEGWVLVIQSPDLATNLNNLIRDSLVRPWMQNNLERLVTMAPQLAGAVAQDGGMPIAGLLAQAEPELQRRLVREFFLT